MHLHPLPALTDNYIWLLHDDSGNALVVDPGEAPVVEQALKERNLKLRAILLTHHHPDHIGGVSELLTSHQVPVYAPRDERISEATHLVADGDVVKLAAPNVRFEVLCIPGHTLSHVAYVGEGLLMAGDTLFSMGCGRMFEGTPSQMLGSLDRLASLPDATLLCAGHEYTETNARFAYTIDPGNAPLQERMREVAQLRQAGRPTLPVAMGTERLTNPFLRVDTDEVVAWCTQQGAGADRVSRFAALRAAKDGFR